jgi:hypothetical protein
METNTKTKQDDPILAALEGMPNSYYRWLLHRIEKDKAEATRDENGKIYEVRETMANIIRGNDHGERMVTENGRQMIQRILASPHHGRKDLPRTLLMKSGAGLSCNVTTIPMMRSRRCSPSKITAARSPSRVAPCWQERRSTRDQPER